MLDVLTSQVFMLTILLLGVGAFAGLIAGLFGIGGGVVIVPALYYVFEIVGAPEDSLMRMAVGTSLTTILVTSLRSLWAHHKHDAVDYEVLRRWGPLIALGAVLGATMAEVVSARTLTLIFATGALGVAINMARGGGKSRRLAGEMPTGATRAGLGVSVGAFSSLMGIGGGLFGVSLMTLFGRSIHQAVATSSGFGIMIAIPGALGFMFWGAGASGMPPFSVGYVNLLAFALIASMTAITAPIGAKLAHRADRLTLSRVFAVYLAFTALSLYREALIA